MPRDTSWEDVWAEYDAREATHAAPAHPVAAPAPEPALAEPLPVRPGANRRPRRLAMGALLALCVMLLGSPFGEAGAPAVAGQEQAFQRHTMIVVGLSGQAEMGESPASAPPQAVLLAETALLSMAPPAWVQPSLVPAAEATPAAETRRAARPSTRRLARSSRPPREVAMVPEAEQPWFAPAPQQRRMPASARSAARNPTPSAWPTNAWLAADAGTNPVAANPGQQSGRAPRSGWATPG